jgi:hypothetical protein
MLDEPYCCRLKRDDHIQLLSEEEETRLYDFRVAQELLVGSWDGEVFQKTSEAMKDLSGFARSECGGGVRRGER